MHVFFQQEKEGHRIYFVCLWDITPLQEYRKQHLHSRVPAERLSGLKRKEVEQYYGMLPYGFGLSRILLDKDGNPADYEIVYINQEMEKLCGNDLNRIRHLILKAFGNNTGRLLRKAYRAAFLGERMEYYTYSSISGHYLQLTLFQHEYGYAACLLRDITHRQIYEDAFNSMVQTYREVYFLQLQENYCRMIYPNETLLSERGNYEAMVERHFGTGKILKINEKNVRQFLSLNNLRTALQTENSVEYRYRRRGPDTPDEWCETAVTISERENGRPKSAIITIRSIEKLLQEEEEHRQQHMVETLATLSDAFFIYRAVKGERILYANPAMLNIFGCQTMTELMDLIGCSFRGIVHPEDLSRVEWEIQHQIRNSERDMDYVQYRIIRKDGEIRWVSDWGHLKTSQWGEEHRLFYVFLKDVTDSITSVQKEKLLNSNRFYKEELPAPDDGQA